MKALKELVDQLPPDLQQEVRDLVEFLLERRSKKHRQKRGIPRFDWAGTLKELREGYTSVELQHKIVEWRIGER